MPLFDSTTRTKITNLRARKDAGENIEVYELVKVEWPEPDGTIYYCTGAIEGASVAPSVTPLEVRLVPDNSPNWFLPVKIGATIGDEEVELVFWDGDGVISDLLVTHGEGIKTTLYYWFPQETLLLPIWQGHLRNEDEAEVASVTLKAVQGFRASDVNVPGRAHYQQCQAVFGGLLETQDQIDEGDCPYNFHIGGSIGNNDPDTGEPWTFCDRRDTTSCTARGVNPLFHLSHKSIGATVVNNQTHGPRLYSTSLGNETNLKEPVRVVMGWRRIYGMPVMTFRRDLNNNHPDQGWFFAMYEGCEGPLTDSPFTNAVITVGGEEKQAIGMHYGAQKGAKGQLQWGNLSQHGYSGTAYIVYNFGPIDPSDVNPSDASASAFVNGGLANVRQFGDRPAGTGLIASFFYDTEFVSPAGSYIAPTINIPQNGNTPFGDIRPGDGFSFIFSGKITFEFTENYTFTLFHDDAAVLTINGVEVINETLWGTDTGNFSATAATEYDFELRVSQNPGAGYNPWGAVLQWQSSSQALEVVPTDAFSHDDETDGYFIGPTANRVWQIARILCDKRWGFGEDYAKLNRESWMTAAAWASVYVNFTDVFGNSWPHVRSQSNVELIGRKIQQQIDDMCMAGRLSRPFLFDGEIHIEPLRALTEDELADCPVFTDEGDAPNVIVEKKNDVEISTLKISRKSDLDLPNRIECTYDAAINDYLETPLAPVEDVDAQLRAGVVIGLHERKQNIKKYNLLGVTDEAQALKIAWSILDLGPFDEGGLQNNLRIKFKIWFSEAVDLYPHKVIKYESSRLTRYGFTYFRILADGIERDDDLTYTITAQAYNETYMAEFEAVPETPPVDPDDPPIDPPTGGGDDPPVCVLQFGDIKHRDGVLLMPIEACLP